MKIEAPVALWVSMDFATIAVVLDERGLVAEAPPLVGRWAVGKRFTAVEQWARRKDRQAQFAWLYGDGTVVMW